MANIKISQKLYVGRTYKGILRDYDLDSKHSANTCELYAENHVAEPEAQFYSYVLNDVSTIVMKVPRQPEVLLRNTGITPQDGKKVCQGVGGHLGEGVTGLVFVGKILQDNDSFAHLRIGMGPNTKAIYFK